MSSGDQDGPKVEAPGGDSTALAPPVESVNPSRIVARCVGRTVVGLVREHNEDNFVVANLGTGQLRPRDQAFEDEINNQGVVYVVCDGMGGAAAGEVASQMAVDILVEAMRRGGAPKDRDALARRLVDAVEEAGRRIFEAAQKERSRRGMGTTSTVAVLVDKVLFLAEVGDSRAYLLRRGQLKQLTKDQSLVNQLIESGHLTPEEAESFEHSNIILQALGTSETVQVDLTFVELRQGDRLMLCSDGLSGLVHADMLRSTLSDTKDLVECAGKLIEYAEAGGGHDNITVVIVDFDGAGLVQATDADSFGYLQYPLPAIDDLRVTHSDGDSKAAAPSESKRPSRRVSQKPEAATASTSLAPEGDDEGESLLPRGPDESDRRANALWISGGIVALLASLFVWSSIKPPPHKDADETEVMPNEAPAQVAAQAPQIAPEVEEVEVNIHTDVQSGTLLVNGEAKGSLSVDQSRSLKLRPGAYRFEAQSEGSPVAVTVVTVRADADMPMDVFLQLPKGAADHQAAPGTEPTPHAGQSPPQHGQSPPARPTDKLAAKPPSARPQLPKSHDEADAPAPGAQQPQAAEDALVAKPAVPRKPAGKPPVDGTIASPNAEAPNAPVAAAPELAAPAVRPKTAVAPKKPSTPSAANAQAAAAPEPTQKPQGVPDNPF